MIPAAIKFAEIVNIHLNVEFLEIIWIGCLWQHLNIKVYESPVTIASLAHKGTKL